MSLDVDHREHSDRRTPSPVRHVLADGTVVSLRRARSRDLDGLGSLAARNGILCEELELARLVRSDPSDRLVLCASTPVDGAQTVVGVGFIELGRGSTMPSMVLVDPAAGTGLGRLVAEALIDRARELAAAGQVA
jgi:hypothetical protein